MYLLPLNYYRPVNQVEKGDKGLQRKCKITTDGSKGCSVGGRRWGVANPRFILRLLRLGFFVMDIFFMGEMDWIGIEDLFIQNENNNWVAGGDITEQ